MSTPSKANDQSTRQGLDSQGGSDLEPALSGLRHGFDCQNYQRLAWNSLRRYTQGSQASSY